MIDIDGKIALSRTHDGRVARLLMTSPDNLNAMDDAMAAAFRQARERLEVDPPRALVISGQGRAFSAGGDLAMLRAKASKSVEFNRREMLEFYRSFLGLRDLHVPLLVAMQGHAVGAGFCFAAACDLRLADSTVRLAAPFTRLGLHPGMGGSFFLPRSLGGETARDLMLTGRRMDGEEASRVGFLSRLVAPGELEAAIDELLLGLLAGAPLATRALLRSQREGEQEALSRCLEREAAEQAECYARPEFLEGVEALAARREPRWDV